MTISEQKKIILNVLKPFFKENKIKGKNIWQLRYEFNLPNKYSELKCSLAFSNYGEPTGFAYGLSLYCVEKIIMTIQFPSHNFSNYENDELPFNTITGSGFSMLSSETVESLIDFSNSIIIFLETSGKEFIEHYSHLPNILKKMDELEVEGKTWQDRGNGILSGSLDAQFRGLIISKLCNDKNYDKKIEYCDKIFSVETRKGWLPYYEKLKERLKTVEPIYNV